MVATRGTNAKKVRTRRKPADPVADALIASAGRHVATGAGLDVVTVLAVEPPTRACPRGAVTVRTVRREVFTLAFVELRDRLRAGAAFWWDGELPDVTNWRFPTRGGRWHNLTRGDPLFCTSAQARVRFNRMVFVGPGVGDWLVEVTSNYDGSVLPDLRHPSQLFAYGV